MSDLPPVILTYQFWTSPSQLQVSTQQSKASGQIDLVVSSGSTPKYCKQIMVAIPIGTAATDFSDKEPSASANSANWSLSSQAIVKGSDLGLDDAANTSYATFTFDAKDASVYKIDYNLAISLSGIVNQKVGSFDYIVRETSGTNAETLTAKQSKFPLSKVTPSFYLENLVATTELSPLVPATEFTNGAAIRLAWESNGTWFQVYEKNNAKPIYAGPEKTCEVSAGAKTDTTFFLQASLTGDPYNDSSGFEPIYLYDSITITISNPSLTPSSVESSGGISGTTLTASGTATLADVNASGTFGVTGQTTLAEVTAGDVTVNSITDRGALNVTGQSTLSGLTSGDTTVKTLTANGTLNVTGQTTLSGVTAGDTTINGAFGFTGASNCFGNTVSSAWGKDKVAHSDGFVIGSVSYHGNSGNAYSYMHCRTSRGLEGWAISGSLTSGSGNYGYTNNGSFTLPVAKGDTWTLDWHSMGDDPDSYTLGAHYFPLGRNVPELADTTQEPQPTSRASRSEQVDEFVRKLLSVIETGDRSAVNEAADLLKELLR